ncbi:Predicted arabinose efflux permease, MFS family [Olsenella sp. KH3B4]|uniref:MFS transporter n=1 Tax=Olsenella sp. KH3B4 TaxID=1855394 RepID=UPI0008C3608B|nr:MFS transporter [Olsenella sp. KH3B4]SET18795.1 Predicted arabinose efflux permease, MFS family [Olsenella sp. KH3B4]
MSEATTAVAKGKGELKLWTRDLVLIILVNLCVFTNHIMSLSTFPFYIQSLGGTEAVAGICAAAFSFVAVIIRPFVGWWLDNGVRRAALVAGLVLMGLAPLGYVFVPVLSVAIAIRMMHGVGLSFSNSTTATVASDVICRPRFAEGMGYFGMATALASAIAPALGLSLMEGFGFNVLYAVAAVIAGLGLVLFAFVRAPKVDVPKKKLDLRTIINRDSLPATVTMLIFMFTFGALENFVAIFASEASLPSGSIYFLVMSAMLLLVRITLGKLVDQRGEAFFVYSCNAAMLVAFLLLAFVPNVMTYILSAVLAGYAFGGLEPSLQSMAVHTSTEETRGSANSTFLCGYDIGYGLGGGIAGSLITGLGYSAMWSIVSLACVLSVLVYVVWARHSDTSFSKRLANR